MAARMRLIGIALGGTLLFVGLAPWSAAKAAFPSWAAYADQLKGPQFRPRQDAQFRRQQAGWRLPVAARASTVPSPVVDHARGSTVRPSHTGATLPATLPTGLAANQAGPGIPRLRSGLRFRPAQRHAQALWALESEQGPAYNAARLQTQFRSPRARRK